MVTPDTLPKISFAACDANWNAPLCFTLPVVWSQQWWILQEMWDSFTLLPFHWLIERKAGSGQSWSREHVYSAGLVSRTRWSRKTADSMMWGRLTRQCSSSISIDKRNGVEFYLLMSVSACIVSDVSWVSETIESNGRLPVACMQGSEIATIISWRSVIR